MITVTSGPRDAGVIRTVQPSQFHLRAAWLSGTLCRAQLVLGWVTICGQVNHRGL